MSDERAGFTVFVCDSPFSTRVQNPLSGVTQLEATVHDWEAWLRTWNREILVRYDPTKYNAFVDPA